MPKKIYIVNSDDDLDISSDESDSSDNDKFNEFDYDIDKLKLPRKDGLCRICKSKFRNSDGIGVCKGCFREISTMKTQAENNLQPKR